MYLDRRRSEPAIPTLPRVHPQLRPSLRSISTDYVTPTGSRPSLQRQQRTQSGDLLKGVPYYHGNIGREEANRCLDRKPLGGYLLRDQSSTDGFFVLSYK